MKDYTINKTEKKINICWHKLEREEGHKLYKDLAKEVQAVEQDDSTNTIHGISNSTIFWNKDTS